MERIAQASTSLSSALPERAALLAGLARDATANVAGISFYCTLAHVFVAKVIEGLLLDAGIIGMQSVAHGFLRAKRIVAMRSSRRSTSFMSPAWRTDSITASDH